MANTEKFVFDLTNGAIGENIVRDWLENNKSIKQVISLRKDKRCQEADIDFAIEDINQQWHTIEIKTDFMAHSTGNMIFEVTSKNSVGCLARTKADLIYYYVAGTDELHILDRIRLQEYIDKMSPSLIRPMGDEATGYIIKIEELKRSKVIKNTFTKIKEN